MTSAHDFSLTTIQGVVRPLADYRGRVLLVVNVASRCGYTPQYRGLEELHRALQHRGFSVLGVPCNQFGAQEPGSDPEIEAFCRSKYDVTFDLCHKVDVNGPDAAPLFAWLTAQSGGPVRWNFTKFLIGRDGAFLRRFEPAVAPTSKELRAAVEAAVAGA